MNDSISRQAAIDTILDMDIENRVSWKDAVIDAIDMLPSAQPEKTQLSEEDTTKGTTSDCISRQAAIDAIDAILPVEPMMNEYTQGITCGAALAMEYVKQLPSAQPDLSEYSDKLWRAAYERGKKEAQPDIVYCRECRHFDVYNGVCKVDGNGGWQADDYCSTGQRREG